MHRNTTNVLFVSRENGCRSLLAEACLNHLGKGKLKAYSCGMPSELAPKPPSWTTLALQTAGIPTTTLACKAWTDFTRSGAPRMDFVIGLDADSYAQHPAWPGQPVTALWACPAIASGKKSMDPGIAAVQMLLSIRVRVELLVSLHARGRRPSDLQHDVRDLSFV